MITKEQAMATIKGITNGQIFTVVFTKRTTGETRVMNCRKGVKCHLKGGDLPYSPNEKGLVMVYDVKAEGYRSFPYDGLQELRYQGKVLQVN